MVNKALLIYFMEKNESEKLLHHLLVIEVYTKKFLKAI